jgi:hypothetical protein
MSSLITTCRTCGNEFEPSHDGIVARGWRTCPGCEPRAASEQPTTSTRCTECGRQLRAGARTLCYTCLTGGSGA